MKSKKIKKIMLTIPNGLWFRNRTFKLIPYNLALLHALVPDEYEVRILDPNVENLSIEKVREKINDFQPDIVGISASSLEFSKSVHKLAEIVKAVDPAILVVIGGAYATVTPEIPMEDKNIDFAILGEGEERFPMLLEMLNNGDKDFTKFDGIAYKKGDKVIINPMRSFIENLDRLPFPAYGKFDYHTYANKPDKYTNTLLPKQYPYAVTSTSRGCPFNCIYCHTWAKDGKRTRFKSAERVLEEIDWLVNDYGTKELIFLDDNLNLDRNRFVKILKGLIKRDYDLCWKSINITAFLLDEELLELMKASKLYQLILPIESGNQYVLDKILRKPLDLKKMLAIIKKAKELNFEIAADFIIGVPGETWDQIRDTARFADEINVDLVLFHIATPIPKTELYDMAKRNNYLDKDFNFRSHKFFGFGRGYIKTEEFSPQDLHILRAFEWDRINFKTQDKKKRYAAMTGITVEELDKWRKETIKNVGLYFPEENA